MAESKKSQRSTYDRALDMLEARARAVDELRRLLIKKGEPQPDVDAAIERLRAAGILDDANFARQLARSKALGAGLSRRRIQLELTRRGVARDVSEQAIEDVFAEAGYTSILANTDNDRERERSALANMIARRVDGLILATARRRDLRLWRSPPDRRPVLPQLRPPDQPNRNDGQGDFRDGRIIPQGRASGTRQSRITRRPA